MLGWGLEGLAVPDRVAQRVEALPAAGRRMAGRSQVSLRVGVEDAEPAA